MRPEPAGDSSCVAGLKNCCVASGSMTGAEICSAHVAALAATSEGIKMEFVIVLFLSIMVLAIYDNIATAIGNCRAKSRLRREGDRIVEYKR